MPDTPKMTMDDLIEYSRTNTVGEPWLKELPQEVGALLAGMSYLETYTGQIAVPWVEGAMDERQLWEFSTISSFERVEDCLESIQKALDRLRRQPDTELIASQTDLVWAPLKEFIHRIGSSCNSQGFAKGTLMVLVAAMAMRQDLVTYARDQPRLFKLESNNTCRSFSDAAIARMDEPPFGCCDGMPIDLLRQAIAEGLVG